MERITFIDTTDLCLGTEAIRMQMQLSKSNEGILQDFLPRLFKNATQAFKGFNERVNYSINELSTMVAKEKKNLGYLDSMDYSIVRKRPLVVMEGFVGSYVEYSGEVIRGLKYFETNLDKELSAYKVLLGELLTNKTAQLSIKELKISTAERISQEKSQAKYWVTNSHKVDGTVGSVISSLNDMRSLADSMEQITQLIRATPMDNVVARVNEVNSLVNLLADGIKSKELESISRTQISNLSEGILELANSVEHYALQCYRAQFFISAVERLDAALAR